MAPTKPPVEWVQGLFAPLGLRGIFCGEMYEYLLESMELTRSSETSVNVSQRTRCNIAEDTSFHQTPLPEPQTVCVKLFQTTAGCQLCTCNDPYLVKLIQFSGRFM